MSFLAWFTLLVIAAVMFGRAALTVRDEELHASYAQVISCVAYLALLVYGTLPLIVLWSTAHALQFFYLPTPYQRRRHDYYPEALLPFVNLGAVLVEIGVWCLFQQIR